MGKKFITIVLTVLMLTSNFPVSVIAEDTGISDEETLEIAEAGNESEKEETEETEIEIESEEPPVQDTEGSDESNTQESDVSLVIDKEEKLQAMTIQGQAASSAQSAALAIQQNTDLDADEALEIAQDLFEAGESQADNKYPRSQDGSTIESMTVKWITEDTVDDGKAEILYVKPKGDEEQSVRLQINYALSGQHDYEPGDITITIPAHIFKDRSGEYTGTTIIPYPQAPSTKNDYNWNLVGDHYVITNTKKMSAATKGYIQIGIVELIPHELIDMALSEEFKAYIQVTTHAGNTIALRSGGLQARFDTEASISALNKRSYQNVNRVPASEIPEYQRIPGVEEYVKVDWYLWGKISANTEYTIEVKDFINEYDGFIIGAENNNQTESIRTFAQSHRSGETSYITFSTAYPITSFEKDHAYTFTNNVTMTVKEVDPDVKEDEVVIDEQLVTSMTTYATKYWRYHDPEWKDPTGHFNVFKNGNDGKEKDNVTHNAKNLNRTYSDRFLWDNGYYGIYGNALNYLQEGEDFDFSYTVNSIGYIMPWTWQIVNPGTATVPWSRIIENYFQRPVRMITVDDKVYIGRFETELNVLEDYEFVSVEFLDPKVYSGIPKNINDDGSWRANNYADGTFEYSRDYDKTNWPDIDLQIQVNGQWQHYATASWKSGSLEIIFADGSTQSDPVVNLPSDITENWRTVVIFKNAALEYDVRPVIRIKSNDRIKEIVNAEFKKTNTPELYFYNNIIMTADQWDKVIPYDGTDDHWSEIVYIPNEDMPYKDGYDRANGYTTDTAVYPSKTSKQTLKDLDFENRNITIHYTGKVEVRSTISDKTTYEQAIADGKLQVTRKGVWRDLLPKGVTPLIDTIKLRRNDKVTKAYTIENYKGSGRTLLVVEVDLEPIAVTYRVGDMTYYEDVPSITFDAIYPFDFVKDYTDYLHNVISFESDNDEFGSIENYSGELDDLTTNNNIATSDPNTFADAREKNYMTDLNPDRETPSFVYAGVYTKLDLLSAARTSLHKEVMVNNDGYYSSGLYDGDKESNARTVYTGGQYTYRIRMMADESTLTSNIRIYDSLENFYAYDESDENKIDIDAPRWRGHSEVSMYLS